MTENMFSPLTLNITDLLAVPCIFMDQGCNIKLKKKEILEHEKEECRYRKLECPGCSVKFEAFTLTDHFHNCSNISCKEDVKLDETHTVLYRTRTELCNLDMMWPRVLKLTNSKNWFLLCADRVEDELVFYLKHHSGEERKETFSYNLKVSNVGNTFSRSMSGVCTPVDMKVDDAMLGGFTLDVSVKVMEKMCFNSTDMDPKFSWKVELNLFQSDS